MDKRTSAGDKCPFGMVHRKGATNKDSLTQNVESENGRTVLATIRGVPSKVVARNSDDEYRDPGKEAGRRPRLRKAHLLSLR